MATTTVVYAGTVSQGDMQRLSSQAYDAPQARNLAQMLAVVADDKVKVTHVDEQGITRHFLAMPGEPIPDGRDRCGIVVSADVA
jgi:hypothetical protein